MTEMMHSIRSTLGNYHYLCLYGIAVILLLVILKGRKKAFVIPAVLISFVVLNPWFYNAWNAANDYAYWRTLWMIPIIPVCAAVPVVFIENNEKKRIWVGIMAVFVAVFVLAGSFVYKNLDTTFRIAHNAEKLPDDAVMVANALLEIDEAPSVVTDDEIYVYLRQYSGRIRSLFARDMYWGTASNLANTVYDELKAENGDLHKVAQIMLNYDYEYLVVDNEESSRKESIDQAGFVLVEQIDRFGIYHVTGNPTERRTYNEKDQVIAVTYVDEKGEAINGPEGYASVSYEYDRNGRIIKEFHRDTYGNAVLDVMGKAGIERTYGNNGYDVKEVWLGADEKPVEVGGYAIRTWEYDRRTRIGKEKYFDVTGQAACRADTLYAERDIYYNKQEKVIGERYYGPDMELVESSFGYAGYDRTYDEYDRKYEDSFLNTEEQPAVCGPGYSKCRYTYTDDNQLSLVYYYDDKDQLVNAGSAYLHKYLQSLKGRDISIIIAAKDDASSQITATLYDDFKTLGMQTDLRGQYRKSFYAVVTKDNVVEELGNGMLSYDGEMEGIPYTVKSAGFLVGNQCSIVINNTEYAKNVRGLNIVVFDNTDKKIIDSVAFDTCVQEMTVTR